MLMVINSNGIGPLIITAFVKYNLTELYSITHVFICMFLSTINCGNASFNKKLSMHITEVVL